MAEGVELGFRIKDGQGCRRGCRIRVRLRMDECRFSVQMAEGVGISL